MSVLRDIKLARETELNTRAERGVQFPAIIVKVGDSIVPTNRANHIWVLEQGKKANILAVLNFKVAAIEGLEVWVQESPEPGGELEIWGLYTSNIDHNAGNGANFNLPKHSQNHEFRDETNPPIDPVMSYLPSMGMLKTTSNNDLTINLLEHTYLYEGLNYRFTGEILDLTSYVPSTSSKHRAGLIYLDVISNTAQVIFNDPINTIIPLSFPPIPINAIPSSHVILTYGQTTIRNIDGNVTDIRDFLQYAQSKLIPPEQSGDILISYDGSSWSRGLPVTDKFGEIVVDQDGVIVTT